MTLKKAVAKTQRPLAAYLRLTVDRDGRKIGYDVQRKAIERWAEYSGNTIGAWFQDKDVTAADRNVQREEYERLLEEVRAGLWGGIVVWRLDRLVRLSYEFERCYRIIEDAGGFIVSIEPSEINTSTELGRLFMRILVMLAEMEIAGMKSRARGHRLARAEAGKVNGGGPRAFGFAGSVRDEDGEYLNKGEFNVLHDPVESALLRIAGRRIAWEDWDWADVLAEWALREDADGNAWPVVGPSGKPMRVTTLQNILTSPRMVGERIFTIVDEETGEKSRTTKPAVWEPILDRATWERLCAKRKVRGTQGARREYLLSGIAKCGRCGFDMTGAKRKYKVDGEMRPTPTYHCKADPALKSQGACGSMRMIAEPVEEWVIANTLARIEATPDIFRALNDQKDRSASTEALDEALSELALIDRRLTDLNELLADPEAEFSQDEWKNTRKSLLTRKEAAVSRVRRLSAHQQVPAPVGDEDLSTWFDRLTDKQKRALISRLWDVGLDNRLRVGNRFHADKVVLVPRDLDEAHAERE